MKTTVAFAAFAARRLAASNVGGFNVRAVNKDGKPSKVLCTAVNGRSEFSADEAAAHVERLMALNPGRSFVVTPAV